MKKIIFYQSNFAQIGGVETMAYNWCWWLRNYFDITVLYCSGDYTRLRKMSQLVKIEKYDEKKIYECDIFQIKKYTVLKNQTVYNKNMYYYLEMGIFSLSAISLIAL